MLRVNQIKVNIADDTKEVLQKKISKMIGTSEFKISRIVKKSIDARDKFLLKYIYSVDVKSLHEDKIIKRVNNNNVMLTKKVKYEFPYKKTEASVSRPIIIGAGPAGYFCALNLAKAGFKPIVFERGKAVEDRFIDVNKFWNEGILNTNSNVSFGEGGAGTFSDGKLNTGINDKTGRINFVIDEFIRFGAPEDISYLAKPHIGTDNLREIMKNMRNEIISLGGEIHFNSKLIDITKNKDLIEIKIEETQASNDESLSPAEGNPPPSIKTFTTSALVLAIGHSARDTFKMLNEASVPMEPKAFAIGLRIEHPQKLINEAQYGTSKEAMELPASDYKMTYKTSEGRNVYSFCMCPGGFVVNASTEAQQSVVNGMSNHERDEKNANSAIVVNVTPDDFTDNEFSKCGVLAGVEFQRKYEEMAYLEGKGAIPVQLFKDYKQNKPTKTFGNFKPNIKGEFRPANLNNCLPTYVNSAIIKGIMYYGKRLKGFDMDDSILSGIETRTSSPVRIIRNEDFMSQLDGLFPCGEGAGYAGGITSAAVDGIKVAEAVGKALNI